MNNKLFYGLFGCSSDGKLYVGKRETKYIFK